MSGENNGGAAQSMAEKPAILLAASIPYGAATACANHSEYDGS